MLVNWDLIFTTACIYKMSKLKKNPLMWHIFTQQFSRIETYFYTLCKNFRIKYLPDKWTLSSSSLDAFNSEFSRICAVLMITSFLLTTSGNEIFSWESPLKPITWYQRFRNGLNSLFKCCSTNGTWTKVFREFKTY